jgi:dephospho-CoA kinase
MARANLARAEAERRLATQMPMEEKRRRADYLIDCSGDLETTRRRVAELHRQLTQFAL